MKTIIAIAAVLSWTNLIASGAFVVFGLFSLLILQNTAALFPVVLMAAVTLHSYAAIQLNKSLKYPQLPLSHNTPSGIRFLGYVVLLIAVLVGGGALIGFRHIDEVLKQVATMPGYSEMPVRAIIKGMLIGFLLFSICIFINVMLNLSLLRYYFFQSESLPPDTSDPT